MPRPDSHRSQFHSQCCGNCAFSHLVAYKRDLLCFRGDMIQVTGKSEYPVTAEYVILAGEEVGMMEGDEYSKVWGERVVDSDDVCDHWEQEQ